MIIKTNYFLEINETLKCQMKIGDDKALKIVCKVMLNVHTKQGEVKDI